MFCGCRDRFPLGAGDLDPLRLRERFAIDAGDLDPLQLRERLGALRAQPAVMPGLREALEFRVWLGASTASRRVPTKNWILCMITQIGSNCPVLRSK
jgi:hypothetical protein